MADPPLCGGLVSPEAGPGVETAPMRPTLTSKPHQEAPYTYYPPEFGFTSRFIGVVLLFRWIYADFAPTIFRASHFLRFFPLQVKPGPFHGSLNRTGLISSDAGRHGGAASCTG